MSRRKEPTGPTPRPQDLVRIFAYFPGSKVVGPVQRSPHLWRYIVVYPCSQLGLRKRPHGRRLLMVPLDFMPELEGGLLDSHLEAYRAEFDRLLDAAAAEDREAA